MGKRQTRIFQHEIAGKADLLTGQEANVMLHNQTTFHGIILEVSADILRFQDMRLKKQSLQLDEIAEIIVDKTTDW